MFSELRLAVHRRDGTTETGFEQRRQLRHVASSDLDDELIGPDRQDEPTRATVREDTCRSARRRPSTRSIRAKTHRANDLFVAIDEHDLIAAEDQMPIRLLHVIVLWRQ